MSVSPCPCLHAEVNIDPEKNPDFREIPESTSEDTLLETSEMKQNVLFLYGTSEKKQFFFDRETSEMKVKVFILFQ